jgi:hypothetical protein
LPLEGGGGEHETALAAAEIVLLCLWLSANPGITADRPLAAPVAALSDAALAMGLRPTR